MFLVLGILAVLLVAGCTTTQHPPTFEMDLPEGPKIIEGYVYNSLGEPVHKASIDLSFSYERQTGMRRSSRQMTKGRFTDENGYFKFMRIGEDSEYFPEALYDFSVGYGPELVSKQVKVEKGMNHVIFNLSITEISNGSVRGYVIDLALKPLGGLTVIETVRNLTNITDEDGYYEFSNVGPGSVTIKFPNPGYKDVGYHFSMLPGLDLVKNFTLITIGSGNGGIEGYIKGEYNNPLEYAEVITLYGGQIVSVKSTVTGHYEFKDLEPGKYWLMVVKHGYNSPGDYLEVSPNVITRRDFETSQITGNMRAMKGFIIDQDGNPVDDAMIEMSSFGSVGRFSAGASGHYSTGSVISTMPQSINMKISAPGFEDINEVVSFPVNAVTVKHFFMSR